jgi:hypothetical protein
VPYTCDNERSGAANVPVRVADAKWRDMFSDVKVQHIVSSHCDHCPLLVELCKDAWERNGPRFEGSEKTIRGVGNESQLKFITKTWSMSQIQHGVSVVARSSPHRYKEAIGPQNRNRVLKKYSKR